MRIPSKFFKPLFPLILDSRWEDGRKMTFAELEHGNAENPYCYVPKRNTPEEDKLEWEAVSLCKAGNRVFAYYLEGKRWVTREEFSQILRSGK
jgi:hypothetical protein